MRIVHVIQAFPPCRIWGGPPEIALVLSKALQARGHEVHILTTNILDRENRMSEHTFEDKWEGLPVTYLNAHWLFHKPNSIGLIFVPDLFKYRHLIRDADVVHIHEYRHFMFTLATQLARYYQVPYVVQPHNTMTPIMGRAWAKRIYDRVVGPWTVGKATGGAALNDNEYQREVATGVTHVRKILNPIDPHSIPQPPDGKRFRGKFDLPADQPIVLFLARLHYVKGLDMLIEAFAQLNHPQALLCIVGPDDGFEAQAREMVASHGLDARVRFLGGLYGMDKYDAYAAADVYALPTRGVGDAGEGLPTTVLEACQVGTPIVITESTEISGVIHEAAGLAVPFDAGEMAAALDRLLADEDLRRQYVAHMPAIIRKHFDIDTIVPRFEQLYRDCIQEYA